MDDACRVAAHLGFSYSAIASAQAETEMGKTWEQMPLLALVSSRVFINVHHDFGLEPAVPLPGAKKPAKKRR